MTTPGEQPPDAPPPPPVAETPLERQVRTMAEAVERLAVVAGLPPRGGGGGRPGASLRGVDRALGGTNRDGGGAEARAPHERGSRNDRIYR